MNRSGSAPASFVRPALLEGILLVTGASVAILSILAGDRINSTALVEFGMLSAIAAASAGVLFARYAVEVCGIVAGCRTFEHWSMRLNATGYIVLGLYAAANALLDLTVPRREADQFQVTQQDVAGCAILRVGSYEGPAFSLQVTFQFAVKPETCPGRSLSPFFHGSSSTSPAGSWAGLGSSAVLVLRSWRNRSRSFMRAL